MFIVEESTMPKNVISELYDNILQAYKTYEKSGNYKNLKKYCLPSIYK
jgi:hypothetical protein